MEIETKKGNPECCGSTIQVLSTYNSLPSMNSHSLPIPLLDTRFGHFEAPVHSTQPSKGGIF